MTFWAAFKIIVKYLPELIEWVKDIVQWTQDGVEEIQIRARLRRIDKAFKNPDRIQAAGDLDSVFTTRKLQ